MRLEAEPLSWESELEACFARRCEQTASNIKLGGTP